MLAMLPLPRGSTVGYTDAAGTCRPPCPLRRPPAPLIVGSQRRGCGVVPALSSSAGASRTGLGSQAAAAGVLAAVLRSARPVRPLARLAVLQASDAPDPVSFCPPPTDCEPEDDGGLWDFPEFDYWEDYLDAEDYEALASSPIHGRPLSNDDLLSFVARAVLANFERMDSFFSCADEYMEAAEVGSGQFRLDLGDLGDRHFVAAIKHVLSPAGKDCPLARSVAHVLTADLALWLSRPFVAELRPGLERLRYDAELRSFIKSEASSAMRELASQESGEGGASPIAVFDGLASRILRQLARTLDQLHRVDSLTGTDPSAIGSPSHYGRYFRVMAAAMDPAWNEVWLPAAFKDASSFWGAVDPAAAPDSTHLQTLPLKELVRRQEDVLEDCFFQCLRELQVAKSNGKLQSFWPRGSTLLGLLRHGRLFGHFENGQTDCVGDDIDFTIRLPQAEGASRNASETGNGSWPRFVRAMADALKAHGYDCWVGARAERLALPGGIYEQLLCNRETNGFVCPVSFVRAQDEALTPETSTCSAYGQPVECPSTVRILKELANYGGCPALPNIELAALTIGNGCVEWMRNGLAQEQLAELKSRAAKLQSQSFASMQP
ncbi:unnamed protein product, partial [Polarella glacialis]